MDTLRAGLQDLTVVGPTEVVCQDRDVYIFPLLRMGDVVHPVSPDYLSVRDNHYLRQATLIDIPV